MGYVPVKKNPNNCGAEHTKNVLPSINGVYVRIEAIWVHVIALLSMVCVKVFFSSLTTSGALPSKIQV